MAVPEALQPHVVANDCPVALLDCVDAFQRLTPKEKLYAHYISQASWEGAKICLFQTSHESPTLFALLQRLFSKQTVPSLKEAACAAGVAGDDVTSFVTFAAAFLANLGNYRSFGDSKILPGITKTTCLDIIKSSDAFKEDEAGIMTLWTQCSDAVFSTHKQALSLGMDEDGVSTYYSSNVSKADAGLVQKFMDANGIASENTRLWKTSSGDKPEFELRLAGVGSKDPQVFAGGPDDEYAKITVVYNDYAPIMTRIVENLRKAAEYAASDVQRQMLEAYAESFTTGSLDAHKDGSRFWIKDKGPVVESYIGFIETYRDPTGVRAEWEGFAAVVNKETSEKFGRLVDGAEGLLKELPWPRAYDKDSFLRPDFTSLEVLAFGSSGVPAGINIPNYDDIRQEEGFKNVSLGNMLKASLSFSDEESVTFLHKDDQALYKKTVGASFDVQVGLHELLGHGSGKLFKETGSGSFNFDRATTNPCEEGSPPVSSWYSESETWDSKFGSIASSVEECRAECVGLYLCGNQDALQIYGHEKNSDRGKEITYINWLHMCRAGVLALQYFTPGKGLAGWGQAHMMARHVILKVLLEAGGGLVEVVRGEPTQAGGKGTYVKLDKSKIDSVGMPAIGAFLTKLQVYKSTANVEAMRAMYTHFASVESPEMVSLRDEVIANRKPRRLVVQHVTKVGSDGESVDLISFEPTTQGLIESFVARYPPTDDEVEALAAKDHASTKPAFL